MRSAVAKGMKRGMVIATSPDTAREFRRLRKRIVATDVQRSSATAVKKAMAESTRILLGER